MVLKKYELEAKLKDEQVLIKTGVLRDENPLDTSAAFSATMAACRLGDLKRVQELISEGVNINGKDVFDYTPLIVASLCGHFELVQLLLEAGALAERNTFQGERCIYNALNDRIRNLLLQYDYSKSTDPYIYWSTHISTLLSRERPATSDITLQADPHSFALHKFILAARSPYFRRKLTAAPETPTWRLPASIPPESFFVVLRYLYLGDLPKDLGAGTAGVAEEEDVLKGVDKVSKDLGVEQLWEAILSAGDRRLARQRHQDEVERALAQFREFFGECVVGKRMVVAKERVPEVRWRRDNSIFADCLLRADVPAEEKFTPEKGSARTNSIPVGPAEAEQPGGDGGRAVLFPAHKAMLIRCQYFESMFSSVFREAQESQHLHVVKVDCSPDVLEIVLSFLYTESAHIPLDLALEVLYAADMLLLDALKTRAATAISALGSTSKVAGTEVDGEVEEINVYDVMRAAWDLRVPRLEEFVARYLAGRLEDYIDEDEFAELITESASRVRDRQETDTIELLDDIRYYLSERFRLRFEDAGLDEMMDEEVPAEDMAGEKAAGEPGNGVDVTGAAEKAAGDRAVKGVPDVAVDGVLRTLDGAVVADEFDSDAANYQILLRKIDDMLDRLKLDA